MQRAKHILPIIVAAQFFCSSIWFAGNALAPLLPKLIGFENDLLAQLSIAVQSGFISGTLVYAVLSITDRFSPSRVFFFSALPAAIFNLSFLLEDVSLSQLLLSRFLCGFFLAGIYPVGMKIASDHYSKGLGTSLGYLVGALVLGTAFPHAVKSLGLTLNLESVVYTTSLLCLCGGTAILLFVPDGPYRKISSGFRFSGFLRSFKNPAFRSTAFGYFGHMWELYSFWVFLPLILDRAKAQDLNGTDHSMLTFLIIASGSVSCVAGAYISRRAGLKRSAASALFISFLCCVLSPFFLDISNGILFMLFLFIWVMSVIADSPLFSTLIAQNAEETYRGSALTIVNSIGFAITIISIQTIAYFSDIMPHEYLFVILGLGPLLGLIVLFWNLFDTKVSV